MNYVVLDMEWNQPFSKQCTKQHPFPLTGEIIQLGAYMLDERFEFVGDFAIYVAPRYYKKLQSRVKRITGITQAALTAGRPFAEAIARFRDWCGEDFVLLTWGRDDMPMLLDNLRLHKLDAGWVPPWFNLQLIYSKQVMGDLNQRSLSSAMEHYGIEQRLSAHNAHNDAYYAALVAQRLDMEAGLRDYFTPVKTRTAFMNSHVYSTVIAGFASREAAMQARTSVSYRCPACGCPLPIDGWIQFSISKAIGIAACKQHGDYLARVKVSRAKDGSWKLAAFLYVADQAVRGYYAQKRWASIAAERRQLGG
ncbi:MAG: 3'-5' exonuclease [Clostridia bacterium]|nr:3'-5' exonuclease [Clostridia bacterium]